MNDILPGQAPLWATLHRAAERVFSAYGYGEIRLPIVEKTRLFERSIGEVTDIVEKEMYTFDDRGGDSITLRPEGTAGCVRAAIQHGLVYNQVQRLWYAGPMFRHERPQKGRYRQFHQIGVEAFGLPGPDVDVELIAMSARLWRELGIANLRLEINSLGTPEARARYRDALVEYFSARLDELDDDSRLRLHANPLRILDSKNSAMQSLIQGAPSLSDYLDGESADHFNAVCARLDELGIAYDINQRLVRGLDYYTRTVFEWLTDELGAQDAVCSGGRYDGLVEQLGGKPTPAVGFALGVERLVALMQQQGASVESQLPHAYMVHVGEGTAQAALALSERLRDELPRLRLLVHAGAGGFRAQLRAADHSGAEVALILGEDEARRGMVQMKPLRSGEAQQAVSWEKVSRTLASALAGLG
jgi:histidyl-tRNA synthetase